MAGSKRERELHRAKVARQRKEAAEAAERRRKRLRVGAAATAGVLVLAAVLGVALAMSSSDEDTPAASPVELPVSIVGDADAVKCKKPSKDEPKNLQYEGNDNELVPDATYIETMTTNCGEIVFTMDAKKAPKTTAAISFLSDRDGYFDDTSCHRLTTDGIYVLQCGDPKGDGTGGPGFEIGEENLPAAGENGQALYPRGTIAMANAGPGTTGSQFFIVYKDSTLPPSYTVLGGVTKGLEIVDAVAAKGVKGGGSDGPPAQPVKIDKMVSSVTYKAGP